MSNIFAQEQVTVSTSRVDEIELTDAQLEAVYGGCGNGNNCNPCHDQKQCDDHKQCDDDDWDNNDWDNNDWWGRQQGRCHRFFEHHFHNQCNFQNHCNWS